MAIKKKKKEETTQIAGIGGITAEQLLNPQIPPTPTTQLGVGTYEPVNVETSQLPLKYQSTSKAAETGAVDNKYLFKGVDVSKSFKESDFATPEDYEQAKRRAETWGQTGESSQQLAEQQQKQQILSELGVVGDVSDAELAQLVDLYGLTGRQQFKEGFAGAFREGTTRAVTRAITYGGAGLAGGAMAGGVGAPIGAVGGVIAGIVSGYWSALREAKKSEAKEDVSNIMAEFKQLKTGMTQVATLASAGYINEVEAVELYNAQLSRMMQIEAQIKYLQDTNLKDYLSDGSDDLAQVQTYLNQVAPVYAMRIRTSLMNPTTKVPYSDIIMQDMMGQQNE